MFLRQLLGSRHRRLLRPVEALLQNRTAACRELLTSALAITDDLLNQSKMRAAVAFGAQRRFCDR